MIIDSFVGNFLDLSLSPVNVFLLDLLDRFLSSCISVTMTLVSTFDLNQFFCKVGDTPYYAPLS